MLFCLYLNIYLQQFGGWEHKFFRALDFVLKNWQDLDAFGYSRKKKKKDGVAFVKFQSWNKILLFIISSNNSNIFNNICGCAIINLLLFGTEIFEGSSWIENMVSFQILHIQKKRITLYVEVKPPQQNNIELFLVLWLCFILCSGLWRRSLVS